MKQWEWFNQITGREESLEAQALRMIIFRFQESNQDPAEVDVEKMYNSMKDFLNMEAQDERRKKRMR